MTYDELYLEIKKYVNYITGLDLQRIYQGRINNIPLPEDNDFCYITIINNERLSTPTSTQNIDKTVINQDMEGVAQIDFYGNFAFDRANAIITASRDISSCEYLQGIQPLYCENARNIPYVSGERQYIMRYMVEFHFEYESEVILEKQGFNEADLSKIITEL